MAAMDQGTRPRVRPRTPGQPPSTQTALPGQGDYSTQGGVETAQPQVPVNPGGTTLAPPGATPIPPPALPQTQLMEGDPTKLASAEHALKSPKYSFLQLAQQGKYGYDQLPQMLAELQGTHGDFWNGWTADKDKFRFTGDPSTLHDAWEGVTEVDAIGGFNSGNPQGFRWGVDAPGGPGDIPTFPSNGNRPPGTDGLMGGGSMPSIDQLLAMFGGLGSTTAPPAGPGVFPADNLQQVGQDPFSQLITGGLSGLIGTGGEGFSGIGMDTNDAISQLLRGEKGGLNDKILNSRMESAREGSERFRSSEMDFLESELSQRGILNDGAMATGLAGISNDIAGQHATALRDIFADESGRADDRFMGALGAGVSQSQNANDTLLGATGQGTERQNVLAQIAMDSLGQNMEWQQFISTFGLSRDQLMNDIQMGRMDRVIQLLNLFTQQAQIGAGGYV